LLSVLAVAVTVGLAPRISAAMPSSQDAAQKARAVFNGVFQGTHSDLQLGPFELAYRVHHVQMGSAELFDLGVERVHRTDGGAVAGNDWALSVSVARGPDDDGSRYLGSVTLDVGAQRRLDLSVDSAGGAAPEEGQPLCAPDAGPARTC
jgi:hypothetical protein